MRHLPGARRVRGCRPSRERRWRPGPRLPGDDRGRRRDSVRRGSDPGEAPGHARRYALALARGRRGGGAAQLAVHLPAGAGCEGDLRRLSVAGLQSDRLSRRRPRRGRARVPHQALRGRHGLGRARPRDPPRPPGHDQRTLRHAFYREAASRLVLVASGTGWAPIWSVARAARLAQPEREIVVVAGARDPRNLYMGPAVDWLSSNGVRDIVLTASGNEGGDGIRFGRPTEFLPELTLADTVYAAGAPAMVDAVKLLAHRAGAECHADPFTMNTQGASMLDRLRQMMRAPAGASAQNPLSPRPAGAPPMLSPLPAAASRQAPALERAAPGETRRRATLFSRILARS